MFHNKDDTVYEALQKRGISRRDFLKMATLTAAAIGLEYSQVGRVVAQLESKPRVPVIWLHFQDCTGCTESITRSHNPSLTSLILNDVSLNYHETLMAAAGHQAEAIKTQVMEEYKGNYVLVVEGSIPTKFGMTAIGGRAAEDILREAAEGAMAIVPVGNCAAFGGIPKAKPNPTGAVGVWELIKDKPIINIPGCPPIPEVMTNTIAHILILGSLPELDALNRPKMFFGQTVHDRCSRRGFYEAGKFAESFGDDSYKAGYCLYKLGCKGPTTYNACASIKWNDGTSWPVEAGHPCLGCSEPNFWDAGGFYQGQSSLTEAPNIVTVAGIAAGGAVVGGLLATANNAKRNRTTPPSQVPTEEGES
jgi:hydrogenase small subunit